MEDNGMGIGNTAVGRSALPNNTTGYYNVALGYLAMVSNTTGHSSIGIGNEALYFNTSRGHLIAIGDSALYSNGKGATEITHSIKNIAVGSKALYANTTGNNNTAIGFEAMNATNTGAFNVAVGSYSMFRNTSGGGNTATGHYSLYNNTTGIENTAFGFYALEDNNGNYNSAFGSFALMNNTSTGLENTAIGGYSLALVTTGDNNTAVGFEAAINGNHSQSTFIGSNIDISTARTNVSVLGYGVLNAQCTGNNQVLLGNISIASIRAQVTGITAYSDGRFKTNVVENVPGIEFIKKLRPVTYNEDPEILHQIWKTPEDQYADQDFSDVRSQRYIGFIAQDVEKAAEECGFEFPGIDVPRNENEVYTLRYVDFIMPLVKAVQEQQVLIEKLQKEIEELKAER
jgi:hypothetical protein